MPNARETSQVTSQPQDAEREWLLRLRLKDREAFTGLVEAYAAMLTRAAWLYLGDAHAAEDAVQETLLAVWDGVRRKRDDTPLRAWLLGILANRCRKHIRSAVRRRKRERAAARADATAAEPTAAPLPAAALREAMGRLDGRCRAVVILRYWQGLSVEDTAAALGVPSGTVKSRCHDAIGKLRAMMRHERHDD